ncbi:MAG: hypothetical protein ACYC3G_00165 [Minisyncoccota bacterium]
MKKVLQAVAALLNLARLVKNQPNEKAKIEAAQKGVMESFRGAGRKDVLHVLDEVVRAAFSSDSEAMEPDGMGGTVWNPGQSQIYVDCLYRLMEVLEKSPVAELKGACRDISWRAGLYASIVFFCRQLKITQPLPNLLSFEGRNKAAEILKPMMPHLTEDVLSLLNQAKELSKTNRHEEAKKARERAEKLNQLYSRMVKNVLPQLEKQDPQALTLGKTLDTKENSSETVVKILHDVLKESGS